MPCVYLPGPAPAVTVANNNAAENLNTNSGGKLLYLMHCVVESFDSLMQNKAGVKRYTVQLRVKFDSGESNLTVGSQVKKV